MITIILLIIIIRHLKKRNKLLANSNQINNAKGVINK